MTDAAKDPIQDLQERLSRLEAQVARLAGRAEGPGGAGLPVAPASRPAAPPPPLPARPRAARPPRKPLNPILYIAGAGAGIFLVGAVFFLYWSIERGWIGPEMRFLMGLGVGGALALAAAKLMLGSSPKLGVCLLLAGLGTLMFSFRWGAFEYDFFPPVIGLAGSALSVVLAGALAARVQSGAALCVALAAGLLAPLLFSEGGHHEVALAVYLAVLMAAALSVPYLAKAGARWCVTRWLALGGAWLLLAGILVSGPRPADAPALLGLLLLHYILAGLWIWLPGQGEDRPATPTILWFLATLAATSLGWGLWKRAAWTQAWFAAPVLALALANLLLVKPLRGRLGGRQADLGLLVLAAGLLAVAVPVALDWQWVGPLWSLFALGLAWATIYAEEHRDWEADEARALLVLALGMAAAASLRWSVHTLDWIDRAEVPIPVLNRNFAEAAFAVAAWGLLARRGRRTSVAAVLALEIVANVALAVELGRAVRYAGGTGWAASVAVTLAWALSGALQWLGSLAEERPPVRLGLAVAGYAWLGTASAKLIAVDLAGATTPLRALAFLGVGAILLAAALVANRARLKRRETE